MSWLYNPCSSFLTQGKNSPDAVMLIDAMDLLYSDTFNTFVLVSSDIDFTKLVTRLKESQVFVYGVGERKIPIAFRNACKDFIYIDILKTLDSDENIDVDDSEIKSPMKIEPVKSSIQMDRKHRAWIQN